MDKGISEDAAMTIQEQLVKLNNKFNQLHQDFSAVEMQQKNLDAKYTGIINSIRSKWQVEYDKRNQLEEEILKYYRIAKDNSKKELVHSGIAPQRPDLAKLNSLIEKINVSNRIDSVAGQIIDLASAYVAFVDKDIAQISQKEQSEIANSNRSKDDEQKNLTQKKKQILMNCENYFRGEEVRQLVSLFEMIHREYEITDDYFSNWGKNVKRKRMMLLGFSQYYVDVPKMLSGILKSSLGHHFDEATKMVNCPCGFTTDSHEEIFVEYTDLNEENMKRGVQAILLNFLRYFRPTEYKITILDYLHYNADVLGPMYVLTSMKNGIVEKVPSDAKSLKNTIDILAQYYRKVESKLGTSTVYEFNKTHKPEERIPLRILVINRESEVFKTNNEPEMLYLINNAEKFGITTLRLTKSTDGGSKGKDREKKFLAKAKDFIRIISDSKGEFYIENDVEWMSFKWLTAPLSIPPEFVARIEQAVKPVEVGTKYFKRYPMYIPEKSKNGRRPISIPFAIDEDDKTISCNFENETFAAYIMGAAGSGKSTLLHTIISGLLMNYHPDEVELWLMDFKMLEFKRYVDCMPPHIKYILLEKSEDLVFDIIDKLTELLDDRQYVFSQNGWSKLTEVPVDRNMPAIFVIIDEFAQMSQILKETKGTGYGSDYTIKLENLLAKGRALGLKFIFASQTYTTGITCLTETACKQIQMRFAMKNTPDEIKQTLTLASDEITPEISMWMSSLPAYETLFKWRNDNGEVKIGRFRNMYTEGNEIETMISKINSVYRPLPAGSATDDRSYVQKKPVAIDGGQPKTFKSQIPLYKDYETHSDLSELDDADVLMYAGTPCSFNPVRPFVLVNGISENILIVGGDRENKLSIMLSLFNSYTRHKYPIEIWVHDRSTIYKRYKDTVLKRYTSITDLDDICSRISKSKEAVEDREIENRLVVVLGYEMLASDMEILGADTGSKKKKKTDQPKPDSSMPDMSTVLEQIRQCSDPAEKKRILDEYNAKVNQQKTSIPAENSNGVGLYDARQDFEWTIKRAPNYGTHFMFCFEQPKDFITTKIDEKSFQHKLMFSMSKDDALTIAGNRKANEIEDGVCLYTNGKDSFTMRPHVYRGVPCNGWMVDDSENVVQKRGGV